MNGLFSTTAPEHLFANLFVSFSAFVKNPNEKDLLAVLFPLYHLREWIVPGGRASYKHKAVEDYTDSERLHRHLHEQPEFQIVRDLCNLAKHYVSKKPIDTAIYDGLRVGWGRCGDRLNVTHFVVEGKEIRSIFWPVYLLYLEYFKKTHPALVEFLSSYEVGKN